MDKQTFLRIFYEVLGNQIIKPVPSEQCVLYSSTHKAIYSVEVERVLQFNGDDLLKAGTEMINLCINHGHLKMIQFLIEIGITLYPIDKKLKI